MGGGWDIQKIEEILPQRYPFLFIDKVIKIDEKGGKVVCIKNVSINEDFLNGHFPGNPVLPGAIIIESMAQASIVLFYVLKPQLAVKKPDYYLANVKAKFSKPVKAGDRLILTVSKIKVLDSGGIVKVLAEVDENKVAEAEIMFGVKLNNE